jgi:hypothetical protein
MGLSDLEVFAQFQFVLRVRRGINQKQNRSSQKGWIDSSGDHEASFGTPASCGRVASILLAGNFGEY